jgi:predicted phage terminase large subunit-like protein
MAADPVDLLLERGETLEPRGIPGRYCPHDPSPKQRAFLSPWASLIPDAFYGGAARGGKSDALLMGALQYVDVPGYSAVLVRQTYPMLSQPGGLIPRSKEWLYPTEATYNEQRHEWRFPSGATLVFRHLENAQAIRDYQGGEYQFIGVDEVTDFSLEQFRFLFSRLTRLEGVSIPLRMRSAANPVGPGKKWVHRRYVLNGARRGRLFLPARLEDNPHVDQPAYERSLAELGSVLYRQLRYGDWDVKPEGRMFKRAWFSTIAEDELPEKLSRVRHWDLAATETPEGKEARAQGDPDWTAGLLLSRDDAGILYVEDVVRGRWSPARVEQVVQDVARNDDGRGVPITMEQEPGASGKSLISHYRRQILAGFNFRGRTSSGSKEVRAATIAARAEHGEVVLVEADWTEEFLDELAEFPEGLHDDQVDALSGAYESLTGKAGRRSVGAPTGTTSPSYWRDD